MTVPEIIFSINSAMKKYFTNDIGLKANLKRHTEKEYELIQHIEEAVNPAFADMYKRLLEIVRQNKARLASKIGRK